jgi:hypothetical protein
MQLETIQIEFLDVRLHKIKTFLIIHKKIPLMWMRLNKKFHQMT